MRRLASTVVLALALGACSGGPAKAPTARTPPDLAGFLRLPVATPTSCPPSVSGSTSGRRSPWVGHVDVSVFLSPTATAPQTRSLGATLRGLAHVETVYFESRQQAVAEFARLYTCSAQVPRSQIPASYRLVLAPVSRAERDDLVRTIRRLPGVDTVSCDPSRPCTDVTG